MLEKEMRSTAGFQSESELIVLLITRSLTASFVPALRNGPRCHHRVSTFDTEGA